MWRLSETPVSAGRRLGGAGSGAQPRGLRPGRARQLGDPVPPLQQRMYGAAIDIARKKIRGGPPAGRSGLFETLPGRGVQHQHLPLGYLLHRGLRQVPPGPIADRQCAGQFPMRARTPTASSAANTPRPASPSGPRPILLVSINPPLLAFAELELYGQSKTRLAARRLSEAEAVLRFPGPYLSRRGRPLLQRCPRLRHGQYPALSGRLAGRPYGHPDPQSLPGGLHLFRPERGLEPTGRSVDSSAQMALFADEPATIARLIGETGDAAYVAIRN